MENRCPLSHDVLYGPTEIANLCNECNVAAQKGVQAAVGYTRYSSNYAVETSLPLEDGMK